MIDDAVDPSNGRRPAVFPKRNDRRENADLVFNFRADERGWNRLFHRYIAGFKRYPGMSHIFKVCISDHSAFRASLEKVLAADFDRIIVGHGDVIEKDGKALLRRALADAKVL